MTHKILIVDDSFVMRALLRGIVAADTDLMVQGEAEGRDEAGAKAAKVFAVPVGPRG